MYINGTDYYQKLGNGPWEKVDTGTGSMLTSPIGSDAMQSPSVALSEFKNIATIAAFGDDALVNGKPHYTIYVKLDPQGLKDYLMNQAIQMAGSDATSEDLALMKEFYSEFFKNMRFDIAYKMFVDKDTKIIDYSETRAIFKVTMQGMGTITSKVDSSMNIFDLNQPVVMPTVQ
jgi:hypothetical protein